MGALVNKNLITLKCVLFCFLSGIGCIYPFLPLHMLDVGLNHAEARLISAIAPCVALLGPASLGLLIDKLSVGRGSTGGSNGPSGSGRLLRVVTAICLILSIVFYSLLLAVPPSKKINHPQTPEVLFMCDEDGLYVYQQACTTNGTNNTCQLWDGIKKGVLALDWCEYGCSNDKKWLTNPYDIPESTTHRPLMYNSVANDTPGPDKTKEDEDVEPEEYPPHLCSDGQCVVYMRDKGRMRMPLSLYSAGPLESNATDDGPWCTYETEKPFQCKVPEVRRRSLFVAQQACSPAVRCRVLDPFLEPGSVLAHSACPRVHGDPSYSFWAYFVIRILADIWPTAALALLGAACVIATRETSLGRGDVGRQLAFGTIGLAIFPPLAGLAAQEMPDNPYLVPFVLHAVFMAIGALILLFDKNMPLSTPEWWWHTATGVLALPLSAARRYGAETAAVFAVLVLLGVLWSGIDSYLPWTVRDLHGAFLEVGLTLTEVAIPAIAALWWAEAVVDYIGHSNVFITAFTFYCLRYTGLAYSTDYNWIVVIEILEVFTLSLVWVTAVLYFRHLVPRKYTTTGQALPVIAHFCLGRCIGALIGGMVSSPLDTAADSARDVYRALGIVSLLAAGAYLGLYHLLLAPRCAAPAQAPPTHLLQGLNTNGGSNGTYSPMRVYHEERSRKGHFRY